MRCLLVAIHGILTRQTDASWPDRLDAWMFQRDAEVKVLKKEYAAGPFPRWNCWVKDPLVARGLVNEIELFRSFSPPIWFLAHSNGAVIALATMQKLIERGFWIGGLILTGAACEADLRKNGVLEWCRSGKLGTAIAYASEDDALVAGDPRAPERLGWKLRDWLWDKLIWPYGSLGRTGWMLDGVRFPGRETDHVFTRWYPGGHSTYFAKENRERTFEQIYRDLVSNPFSPPSSQPLSSSSSAPTKASTKAGTI